MKACGGGRGWAGGVNGGKTGNLCNTFNSKELFFTSKLYMLIDGEFPASHCNKEPKPF